MRLPDFLNNGRPSDAIEVTKIAGNVVIVVSRRLRYWGLGFYGTQTD